MLCILFANFYFFFNPKDEIILPLSAGARAACALEYAMMDPNVGLHDCGKHAVS